MQTTPIEINLSLINQKVKFSCVSSAKADQPITVDYLPPLGDGEGFLGLELLVMSFAGCVSTGIVGILRRMGKSVLNYSMIATGYKLESPLVLEKIHFEVMVESSDLSDEDMQKGLSMAEKISPVWIALKNNVEVTWQYKILAS